MTEAVSGFGTLLSWNGEDLAELTSISGPTESMDTIDVTSHGSASGFREFVAGLHDGGEISFEGNFIKGDSDGQIAMHTDFQTGQVRAWIIKMPGYASAPGVAGNGYITAFSINYPFDDKISLSGTIKVTGKPVLTAA
ncbi:MAG TPA: phage tail tube protein [Dehalococcoidales bacterium]|nr:phage tail tube protein [Dehalococcoidales bacterium]